jgi:hypothetical protein
MENKNSPEGLFNYADGGSRTHKPVRAKHFECFVFASFTTSANMLFRNEPFFAQKPTTFILKFLSRIVNGERTPK